MQFVYPKCFDFWKDEEIIHTISEEFTDCKAEWFDTGFTKTDTVAPGKYLRPLDAFEKALAERYLYFAYIKFFRYQKQLYGIVAGKTGSKAVNVSGSDVCFSMQTGDSSRWNAKEFLMLQKDQGFAWAMEKILIVTPKAPAAGRDDSKMQALAIEKRLMQRFSLFGS